MNNLDITNFSPIILGVDRNHVESHDVSDVVEALIILDKTTDKDKLKTLRGNVALAVNGYDNDSRELFEINDFCLWVQKLCSEFSGFGYYFSPKIITLLILALLRAKSVSPGVAQYDIDRCRQISNRYLAEGIGVGLKAGYNEKEMVNYYLINGFNVYEK